MAFTHTAVRRGVFAIFAGALVGAAASVVPTAAAQPVPCTAAGLANTLSGVTAGAGQYLDAHPDANDAITGAGSESPDQAQANLRAYFASHPQQYSELRAIAQPLIDLRNSCPQNVSGAQLAALLGAFTSP